MPNQQQQQQQQPGGGTGTTSLFGGGVGAAGGMSGSSLFGGPMGQQQQQQPGGGFGLGQQQPQQSIFGGQQASSAPFGMQQQGGSSSVFGGGSLGQQGSSLFRSPGLGQAPGMGSSGFGGNTLVGGSLFGGPPSQGSSLFGGAMGGFGAQQQQPPQPLKSVINYRQYQFCGFSGAINLMPFTDAPDLKFGVLPSGRENTPQAYLAAGLIPEPLKSELVEQQVEIDSQDRLLQNAIAEAPTELSRLLTLTAQMDLSVQTLRNNLHRQRQAVEALVDEVKVFSRACERGTSDARRLHNPTFTVDKPVPSDFFWQLLQTLEQNIADYTARCTELKHAAASLTSRGK